MSLLRRGSPPAPSRAARAWLTDYVHEPGAHWHGVTLRQADKLERQVAAIGQRYGHDREAALAQVMAWGQRRLGDRPPPVYVTGLGGSGSRWLAAMIGDLRGFVDAGEVYFPPSFPDDLSVAEQGFVADCVTLLHAWPKCPDPRDVATVNAAAGAQHVPKRKRWDPACTAVHLVRDPGDQVMSVALRKQEYRALVAPTASDEEYLRSRAQANVSHLRAYRGAGEPADLECRYEDLCEDTAATLRMVIEATGRRVPRRRIEAVVAARDAEAIRSGRSPRAGNLDQGGVSRSWREAATPAQHRLLHAELIEAFLHLGYDPGHCTGAAVDLPVSEQAVSVALPSAGSLGLLWVRTGDGAWRVLGAARGTRTVPAGHAVRLRLAPRTDPTALADVDPALFASLCLAGRSTITDAAVAGLPASGVRELDLARTAVTDEGLVALARLGELRAVSLYGTAVSAAGIRWLREQLPDCAVDGE